MNDDSFKAIVKRINRKSWFVSSLYQFDENLWKASLRPGNDFSCAHGTGKTPEEALEKAFGMMDNRMDGKDWKKIAEKPTKIKRERLRPIRRETL